MISFGSGSVSIVNKETGQSFKIDGIQDLTLDMPIPLSTEESFPITMSGTAADSFEIRANLNDGVLERYLYEPVYKSPEFNMRVNGMVQVRRHRKKRINKKWAKKYGYKIGKIYNGRWRLIEYNTKDGEFNFEKVWWLN